MPLWKSIERFNQDPQTIVVVPSMSIDAIRLRRGDPGVRGTVFISVTAAAPAAGAADLCDFTNDSAEHHRLLPESSSGRHPEPCAAAAFPAFTYGRLSASAKRETVERPRLMERIRSLIMDPDRAHLVPFNTTNREKELALQPRHSDVRRGSKIFPAGNKERLPQDFHGRKCAASSWVARTLAARKTRRGDRADAGEKAFDQTVMVKLNEGVSGEGNAVIDLTGLPAPGDSKEKAMLEERLRCHAVRVTRSYLRELHEETAGAKGSSGGANHGRRNQEPERAASRHSAW